MARYLGVSRRRWIFWRQYLWEVPWFTRNCSPMSGKWPMRACWLYREPTLADRAEALERLLSELDGAQDLLRRVLEMNTRLHVKTAATDHPRRLVPAETPPGPIPPKK